LNKIDRKTIRKRFKSSIHRGTGEANLIMKEYSEMDFSSEIIKASVVNHAYDIQCEGSRADFVFDLIELSKQKEKIRKAILEALLECDYYKCDLDQLFDLTARFAEQGDEEARVAIYNRFEKKNYDPDDWHDGNNALIRLDGFEGFKYIVESIGKVLSEDEEKWEDRIFLEFYQEEHPEIDVMKKLNLAAKSNQYIKIYLEKVEETRIRWESNDHEQKIKRNIENMYEFLKKRIDDNEHIIVYPRYFKQLKNNLTNEEIFKLSDYMLKERTRVRISKYLSIFKHVKYPYDYHFLLEQAQRPYRNDDRLVEFAVNSLNHFPNDEISEFALEKLKQGKNLYAYLPLFISNYKEGDGELLASTARRARNIEDVHNLVMQYRKIFESNKTKDCLEPLVTLYDKTNCGICRNEIVGIMIENEVLPDNIREEIKYDSYEETRELLDR
jgi:hypothetical protein